MDSIRNGFGVMGTAICSAARATGSNVKRAAIWCTNSRTKCVLLGTVAVTALAVGAYARNPAAAKELAGSVDNWARNIAFPRMTATFHETILPTAHHAWQVVRGAVYKHGKITVLGGGLIGATVALVIRSIGHALYRFVRPNATVAQRDAALAAHGRAIGERDAAIAARDAVVGERNLARNVALEVAAEGDAAIAERDAALAANAAIVEERDAVIGERDAAIAERDAVIGERDAAIAERNAALTERNAALTERNAALIQRDQAINELETVRNQCAPFIALAMAAAAIPLNNN